MEQINKYQNGKIYKITSANTDKIYIGSTIRTLKQRLQGHLKSYNQWLNKMLLGKITSFDIIEMNNYEIELIEEYKCKNKKELETKERYYIELYKDIVVNKKIPTRTQKEYVEDNKDKIKQYHDQYNIDNQDKIKQYRIDNKDKIKQYHDQYNIDNQDKIKQYRIDNKDKIEKYTKEHHKQYYKDNIDIIKQKKQTKINCVCGSEIQKGDKAKHEKTKKHIEYIAKTN
jgi:hypothetical protein